jgi:hypothetical protein
MKKRHSGRTLRCYLAGLLLLITCMCGFTGEALAKTTAWTMPSWDSSRIHITTGLKEQECTRRELLPPCVIQSLADKNLAIDYKTTVLLSHRDGDILFARCKDMVTGSSSKFLALVKDQTQRGLVLLYDRLPQRAGVGVPAAAISFDAYENTAVDTAALPDECIVQITDMIESFIFVLYDCALVFDARNCVGSVANFASSVFLTYYFCQPETPATVK